MANIKGVAKWAKLGIPKDNYDEYQGNGNKQGLLHLILIHQIIHLGYLWKLHQTKLGLKVP